jgi:MarR family transcriptional regulator for hemolysin
LWSCFTSLASSAPASTNEHARTVHPSRSVFSSSAPQSRLSRALDAALIAAGGSLSVWLFLCRGRPVSMEHVSELGKTMRVAPERLGPSSTGLESATLVILKPDPKNPRAAGFELTEAGDALFHRLLRAVVAFDAYLRATNHEIATFSSTLRRLLGNVTEEETFLGSRAIHGDPI